MHTDIEFENDEGRFKYRCCGILHYQDKFLFTNMNHNNFYCFPGGHCELGEDSIHATKREMEEETGFKINVIKLIANMENIFIYHNKYFHEIGYYYLCEVDEKNFIPKDYNRLEHDKHGDVNLIFKWLTKDELKNERVQPVEIKNLIINEDIESSDFKFKHIVFNECK